MKLKKKCYVLAFGITVALAVLLLVISALLPQEPILENTIKSAEIMSAEGNYPKVADGAYSSQLDNWSESIMLMESVATNKEQMESIFTNPRYSYGENDPVKNLYAFLHDEDPEPTSFYVRYWMGFRVILRLVLGFLDFYQFKRYVAVLCPFRTCYMLYCQTC